jgi:8-oxo-dGTP pyrophosphatase MutT (NUDIX family)
MQNMIEAAGGLLWRKGPGAPLQIALVHRHRYEGDWTLPKGKLQVGESPLQGALREVQEETGYRATVLGFAGAIVYETSSLKLVRFWNMIPESEQRRPIDESEVAEIVWLEPAEACQRMTYPLERALVEAYMGDSLPGNEFKQAPQRPGLLQKLWLWWTLNDIAYENLALHLPVLNKEFAGLRDELSKKNKEIKNEQTGETKVNSTWALRVQTLLESAEKNKVSHPDLAWRFAKAAERALLLGEDALHPGEAEAKADTLLEEAKEKIPSWRGKAIGHLLDRQDQPLQQPVLVWKTIRHLLERQSRPAQQPLLVWKVVRAAKLSDEHQDNSFRRLKILRKRLRFFGGASLVITGGYIALAVRTGILSKVIPDNKSPAYSVLMLAFMGLMGAVLSVLISTKSVSSERVPVQQAQTAVLFGRLAVGPLAALATATLLATGIINGDVPDYNVTVAAAFVSGFSERFVLDSIATFSQKSG